MMVDDNSLLVGGLEHEFLTFHILGIIFPTDELICFRGLTPPTSTYIYIGNRNSSIVLMFHL